MYTRGDFVPTRYYGLDTPIDYMYHTLRDWIRKGPVRLNLIKGAGVLRPLDCEYGLSCLRQADCCAFLSLVTLPKHTPFGNPGPFSGISLMS